MQNRSLGLKTGLRLLYFCIPVLIVLLLGFLYYEVESSTAVDIVLGGVGLLLAEVYILIRLFGPNVTQENQDVIKLIKEQVDEMFGDKSSAKIEARNRKKYYQAISSPQNRLFNPENESLLRSVTAQMRSRLSQEYVQRIRQLEEKCLSIQQRTGIISRIYDFIIKDYMENSRQSAKLINKLKKSGFESYDFYTRSQPISKQFLAEMGLDQSYFPSLTPRSSMSWAQMIQLVQQLGNMAKKTELEMFELCSKLVHLLVSDISTSKNEVLNNLKKYNQAYQLQCSKNLELKNKISEQLSKITTIETQYERLRKKHENYEQELNTELNLKMARVELQNLQIKQSNAQDLTIKAAEDLFQEIDKADKQIADLEITLHKNSKTLFKSYLETQAKSLRFILKYIAKETSLPNAEPINPNSAPIAVSDSPTPSALFLDLPQSYKQKASDILDSGMLDYHMQLYRKHNQELLQERSFCGEFLADTALIEGKKFDYLQASCQKIEREIESRGSNFARKLLFENWAVKVVRTLNSNRVRILEMVRQQKEQLAQKLEAVQQKRVLKGKQIEAKEAALRKEKASLLRSKSKVPTELQLQTYRQNEEELVQMVNAFRGVCVQDLDKYQVELLSVFCKVYLNNLSFLEGQAAQLQTMENQRQNEDNNSTFDQRYSAYAQLRQLTQDLDDQTTPEDLRLLNRLLDVFFEEWRDSEMFHKLIRKQIYLALNLKRPDFLEQIAITYFKIDSKRLPLLKTLRTYNKLEAFHFMVDLDVQFIGDVGLTVQTQLKLRGGIPIQVKAHLSKFVCPIRRRQELAQLLKIALNQPRSRGNYRHPQLASFTFPSHHHKSYFDRQAQAAYDMAKPEFYACACFRKEYEKVCCQIKTKVLKKLKA